MISSPICEMLGIRYPLFQGAMAWIADGKLAAAVSEGGGLGIIAAGNLKADAVREQIRAARSMTDKPFGVNIPFTSRYAGDVARVIAEEKVAVVTAAAGDLAPYMGMWEEAGVKVITAVSSVEAAERMARAGASALIAKGCESGGHVAELTTMVLVPLVCDAVDLPVIAAGGIADGRGAAAAFMLGACGVQMGTRFLSAEECTIHPAYREKVLKANDRSTTVTGRRIGQAVRSIRSPFTRSFEKAEYSDMPDDELEALSVGRFRKAVEEGDPDGCYMAGQASALVNKVQPAAEIVKDVMDGAERWLKGAPAWVK